MDYDADAVIIGAGHNSLTAALYLLKAGYKVLLIERSNDMGGAAKTSEITEPGFKHDLFATNIGLFMGSRVYSDFKNEFHQDGFDVVVGNQPFASVFPNGKCLRIYKDPEKTLKDFEKYSPKDAKSWEGMIAYFNKVAPYIFPVLQMPMPSFKTARQFWKIYRGLGSCGMLELIRSMTSSPRSFLEEYYESEEAKALLSPWAYHLGLGPDSAGGAMFSFLESAVDHVNGMVFSKGGVGNLISAMAEAVKRRGGIILAGQEVSEIIVKKGKAIGVKTEDGATYHGRKGVMACVTPNQFLKLVDEKDLPGGFIFKARNFKFGSGTLMIHLSLDKPLVWDAAEDLTDSAYVHVSPYMSDLSTTYQQAIEGYLPSDPLLVVAQQSRLDPTRAPEGRHVLWVQARAFPKNPRADSLGKINVRGDWDEIKEPICERIIDKLSRYAPDIRKILREKVVLTPKDLENENPNIVGGDMVGGSHELNQNFLFRPFPGWSRYKTPVERLYLTGHSTWPGGGLNATSGHLAAKQMLKDS